MGLHTMLMFLCAVSTARVTLGLFSSTSRAGRRKRRTAGTRISRRPIRLEDRKLLRRPTDSSAESATRSKDGFVRGTATGRGLQAVCEDVGGVCGTCRGLSDPHVYTCSVATGSRSVCEGYAPRPGEARVAVCTGCRRGGERLGVSQWQGCGSSCEEE